MYSRKQICQDLIMTILRYIISLFFLLGTFGVQAQLNRYLPSGVRLGTEVGALPYLIFSQQQNHMEFTGDVDFDRYYAVIDYGQVNYHLNEDTYDYKNNGSYLRVGGDVNFMYKDPHLNIAFFGIRYAMSNFNDQLNYNTKAVIQSQTGWPSTIETSENNKASAHWAELDAGLKVRIYKQLFFGFTVRYKVSLKVQSDPNGHLRPYYIPGFGKYINPDSWGLSYYVYLRIPYRKKVIYQKKEIPKPKSKPTETPVRQQNLRPQSF